MRLTGKVVWNVVLVILAGAATAAYAARTVFVLTPEQVATLWRGFAVAVPAQCLAAGLFVSGVARPIRRVLGARPPPAGALAAATRAVQALPASSAGAVLVTGALATLGVVAAMERAGVPTDLAYAGAGIGVATAILAAMLAYARAAALSARLAEALGPHGEAGPSGTVRAKILWLAFGLNTIAVLLFSTGGYVRYRAEVDREYVVGAERAQASAMDSVAGEGAADGAEVADHVFLVTGAPTALVAPGGAVLALHGPVAAPFERAGDALAAPLRLEDGWLVARRAPGGGAVASFLPDAPLAERRVAFWASIARMGLLVYAATAVLAWLAARAITLPFHTLGRAADRIASGDLTASPPSVSQDEMGRLAADFRRMARGLQALVVDVQSASEGVSVGAREAGAIGERVRTGASDQHAGVVAVQGAVEAMEGSVSLVAKGVGGLSEYVAATTQAVGEMAAALDEVRTKGAELERAMAVAMNDVEHLGASGREAEATLGELEGLAGHAGGTLAAVKASMASLERAAGESEGTATHIAQLAERAGGVVEETVHGIEALRAAVSDAHRRITSLGRRSDDIDHVVDFISEVAGRTNLLSLNASIIAAQAGQHGKAFAVVADQIRELATQIARSTKSIGDIIHGVRDDVEGTAALIDRGDALAVEGVQLARNSLEALAKIQRSTGHGMETAAAIRAAVDAHGQSAREVSQLVESVANGSRAVAQAVQLVGRSVAGVNSVSRSVSAMADQVARALEDQSGLGRRQLESLGRLERMIEEITRAVQNHDAATRRVRDALQDLSQVAGAHDSAVEGLSGVSDRLGSRARALAETVGRFKV
jgi:methyl-accepting chemotaxis protein